MEEENKLSLYGRTMQEIENRRQRILDGGVNCIPSPFKRFSDDFCGIEQDTYYCVTSFTKGGKSQLVSFMFIFQAVQRIFTCLNLIKNDERILCNPLPACHGKVLQNAPHLFCCLEELRKFRVLIKIEPHESVFKCPAEFFQHPGFPNLPRTA